MRKTIRRAGDTTSNCWLPGFEPDSFIPEDHKPSFASVVQMVNEEEIPPPPSVTAIEVEQSPPPIPPTYETPPSPPPVVPDPPPQVETTERVVAVALPDVQEPVYTGLDVSAVSTRQPTFFGRSLNFQFRTDFAWPASPGARVSANLEAIRLMKHLSSAGSTPEKEEMEVLAKYSGWGGLSEAFGGKVSSWDSRRQLVRAALDDGEYETARSSVLNAHYTSPSIIQWIYAALLRMGFSGGRVLDPCTGTGNFLGAMPGELAQASTITAVELDPTSASIAQLLYPGAQVVTGALEATNLPDSWFNVVIGNVPFGDYTVHDPALRGKNALIHDYFFLKSATLVRPGGLIALITSTGTMDKLSKNIRVKLRSTCDLVCAFRLPSSAFKETAGTEVATDVIFLRRRLPGELPSSLKWLDSTKTQLRYQELNLNEYFIEHDKHIVGELQVELRGSQRVTKVAHEGLLEADLKSLLDRVPEGIYSQSSVAVPEKEVQSVRLNTSLKANAYCVADGTLMRVGSDGVTAVPVVDLGAKVKARVVGMVRIRDALKQVLRTQVDDQSDEEIAAAIKSLNRQYDSFITTHGYVHERANRLAFKDDPDFPSLLALEEYDDETATAKKMPIFERRTIMRSVAPTVVETVDDAYLVSLNWKGTVDPQFMSSLLPNFKWESIAETLTGKGLAWLNPESQKWEPREVYLAGNVRKKLRAARLAALTDSYFNTHVEALEKVIPVDLSASEISANLGAAWVPDDVVLQFARELIGTDNLQLKHVVASASWKLSFTYKATHLEQQSVLNTQTWGTSRCSGLELLNDALNQATTTVYDVLEDKSTRVNEKETMLAREKVAELRSKFREWVWGDDVRAQQLVRLYNDEFNSTVLPEFDGAHLTLPGLSDAIKPRKYQIDAVWRYLCGGNLLVGFCVGAGKTATAIIANMEAKRLGIFKKPMYVVPNHMLHDFGAEHLRLYPAANILCASKEDLVGDRRREMLARIATGDWDACILTHSTWEKMPLGPEHLEGFIDDELSRLDEAISDAWADGDRAIAKRLEGARKSVDAKLSKLTDASTKDQNITFDQLGVDALCIDESQVYKNLLYVTKMSRVAGLQNSVSRRALDAYSKIIYVQSKHSGDRGVMFTTATPISNSMAEMFTLQRYLSRKLLREHDLDSFDAWAATFGRVVSSMEVSPDGGGFRMNSRFAQFVNLPELMKMFGSIADIKTREEINLPVPRIKTGRAQVVVAKPSDAMKEVVKELVARAEKIRAGSVKPYEDNMLAVTGDGRRAALDLRIHDPHAEDEPGSKVNLAVQNVFQIWERTAATKATQLVFCDLSTPKKDSFNVYHDMRAKWIRLGVPEDEIAFIHDYDTDALKASLFRRVRKGSVRILLGSTSKMGVGTNVQRLLYALHHLDAPWRPDEVEQRDGRALRPGNLNEEIEIFRYVTESTFDAYMWQTLEAKAKFVAQVMSPGCSVRSAEDVVVAALSYAEVKAISTGSMDYLRKAEVDATIAKLCLKKRAHEQGRDRAIWELGGFDARMRDALAEQHRAHTDRVASHKALASNFALVVQGRTYDDHKTASNVLRQVLSNADRMEWSRVEYHSVGQLLGFEIQLVTSPWATPKYIVKGELEYRVNEADSVATAMMNTIRRIEEFAVACESKGQQLKVRGEELRRSTLVEFAHDHELSDLYVEQDQLLVSLGLATDQSYGADGSQSSDDNATEEVA